MPSFGEKLKAEREKRAITLEQISLSTKIGTRMLQALEEDKFNQLPGGIFNKGFVRAYARCLGIDEDQAVADYLEASGETAPTRFGSDPDGGLGKLAPGMEPPAPAFEKSRELPWGLFAAALLAIALGLSLWTHHKRTNAAAALPAEMSQSNPPIANGQNPPSLTPANAQPAGTPESAVPQKAGASRQIETTVGSSKPASAEKAASIQKPSTPDRVPSLTAASSRLADAASPVAGPGEFTVLVQVRDDSWLSITADGKTLASYLANAGAQRVVHGRQLVTIKAGNVGGVDFLFNGKRLTPQGESGEVKTLTFGPEGLQPTPPSVAQ